MKCINLRLLSSDLKLLIENDIYPDDVSYLAQILGSQLVQKGYANERYKVRIIPHWHGEPDLQGVIQLDESYKNPSGSIVDLEIDGKVLNDPIKFFTVRLYSSKQQLTYQLDYEPSSLFIGTLERVFTDSIRKGLIKVDESVRFEFRVKEISGIKVEEKKPIMPVYIQFVRPAVRDDRISKSNMVKIKEQVPLFKRLSKRRVFFTEVEKYQAPRGSALQIYMQRQTYQSLKESVQVSKIKQVEVAGVLLGNLCEDGEGTFLDISTYHFPDEAVGAFYSVRIDANLWTKIINDVNVSHPDKIILGWFHTHLISKVDLNFIGEKRGELRASRRSFLSQDDHFIHNSFFTQDWHVALLIDFSANRDLFYYRYQNHLVDTGGFYIYQEYKAE